LEEEETFLRNLDRGSARPAQHFTDDPPGFVRAQKKKRTQNLLLTSASFWAIKRKKPGFCETRDLHLVSKLRKKKIRRGEKMKTHGAPKACGTTEIGQA